MVKLYDHRGMPIDEGDLQEELAAPKLASIRTPWFDSVATGLTPERLGYIMRAVDQNDTLEYLTLAEEMEERDLHYQSVLSTRKHAVEDLNVVIEAVSDEPMHVEHADFIRGILQDEDITGLVADLLDGLGKSYSVCEIMWDKSGKLWEPNEYIWRDPRFFQFDDDTGTELRLRDESDPAFGLPLAPYKFIEHRPKLKTGLPIRGGLARLAAVAFMCKGYSIKDWLAFAETFGMPLRVGKYGAGASADDRRALLRAVSNIGTDAAAIIPESMMMEFIEASKSAGGEKLFEGLANWLDRQVSKGVLGQVATTEGTPGKLGADDTQDKVRSDIKDSDARQLARTLKRDLVKPLIDLNFGQQSRRGYPKIRLASEEPEDLESLSRSLPPFISLGLRVEESVIRDKFGLPEPEKEAVVLKPPAQGPSFSPFGGGTFDDVEDDDDLDIQLEREQKALTLRILREAKNGDLTEAQMKALEIASRTRTDESTRQTERALTKWKRVMNPVLNPLLELAGKAKTYEEFRKGLDKVQEEMDPAEFMKSLALATFKLRGLGDGTDNA